MSTTTPGPASTATTAVPLTPWAAAWYSSPSPIDVNTAPLNLNGLADTNTIIEQQHAANEKNKQLLLQSNVWSATPAELFQDVQEAVVGIPADLMGQSERKTLPDILSYGNRLRGLGILLVGLAIILALINSLGPGAPRD